MDVEENNRGERPTQTEEENPHSQYSQKHPYPAGYGKKKPGY